MKKIIGLDLGVASIGWAFIKEAENENEINELVDIGVRIIPLSTDSKTQFEKGQAITLNQDRTLKRVARRNLDRYQLRRKSLVSALKALNMLPGQELFNLNALELYGLRNKAVNEKIELNELGRILLHLNQKRGYKSSRKEKAKNTENSITKESDYLSGISTRSRYLLENNLTIGQKIYNDFVSNFKENKDQILSHTIKNEVYPRHDYISEFNKIWDTQQKYYPTVLTEQIKLKIRDEIIYHQRPLKSQKGLVSICEFEAKTCKIKKDDKLIEKVIGPKVAVRSNPVAQMCRLWESINTISLESKEGNQIYIPNIQQKHLLYEYLCDNEKLGINDLRKILKLDKSYRSNQQLEKVGIKGNDTLIKIKKALESAELSEEVIRALTQLQTAMHTVPFDEKIKACINNYQTKSKYRKFSAESVVVDMQTGEELELMEIGQEIEKEPLYEIWHLLHSIDNEDELEAAILKHKRLTDLGLTEKAAEELSKVVFKSDDYGNKSVKAIRKILPYLMNGYVYSDACALAGYNHSDSSTKEQNLKRELLDQLPLLKKGELRQPVVEKILNQLINIVNAIIKEPHMGRPDEIRVELARELQQSAEERSDTYSFMNKRSAENDEIAKEILKYGLKPTGHRIKKWRVWHETHGYSLYTGKTLGLAEFLNAEAVDIEHIIPQSKLFDNSLSNWAISERDENIKKGNMTAYDWMKSKGENAFNEYVKQVNHFYQQYIEKNPKEKGIYRAGFSKRKRDYLLMSSDKIPSDFINRQLNETRYISRKSTELLKQICFNVKVTGGSVTDYLRHHWGYDNILHDINFERYKNAGLTYINEDKKERIIDWTKRMDHRHHALDALVVACTKQSLIQRLNNLNKSKEFSENLKDIENKGLKKVVSETKLFNTITVQKKLSETLVSFKAGKRVVSRRKNKIGNQTRLEPRGPLHEESVYGLIRRIAEKPVKLNAKFDLKVIENIVNPAQKQLIIERLQQLNNDPAKAFDKLNKNPIWIDKEKEIALTEVKVYEPATVIKYKLNETFKEKDADYIVDGKIKELVKQRFKEKGAAALKNLENDPILYNGIPVKSVRCFAELTAYETLKYDKEKNKAIAVVKPGNNHHVTICEDENGKRYELETVTFWEAVARAKNGIPIYSTPKESNHKVICHLEENEIVEVKSEEFVSRFFRLQKLTSGNYWFMNIFNTQRDETLIGKKSKTAIQFSPGSYEGKKVKINILGKIK